MKLGTLAAVAVALVAAIYLTNASWLAHPGGRLTIRKAHIPRGR
jgi:hypothetical protein